jgi:L-alanine-DL-glutamate epimerase-like enolase superfamily enzyme
MLLKRDALVVQVETDAGMHMEPDGYAREAETIAERGFRAYKMRPARGPAADLETVQAMRKAVGPDFALILMHSVDYIQMDVCCQGGMAMGRRLFSGTAREQLKFAFHSWGTALEVVAAEVLADPLQIDRGDLIAPREPGLGIKVNEQVVGKYPWIPGPGSLFRTDSPERTVAITSDHSIKWESA